jgi:hypothetical protein
MTHHGLLRIFFQRECLAFTQNQRVHSARGDSISFPRSMNFLANFTSLNLPTRLIAGDNPSRLPP